MRKVLLLLPAILAACGGAVYTATGLWQGTATNRSEPYDSVLVRFDLEDQSGTLSGSHFAYLNGAWTYIGPVRGSRTGKSASWRVDAPNGYVQVDGRFEGDRFSGTYYVAAYGSGSLAADLSSRRDRAQSLALLPESAGALRQLLEELR